MGKKTFTLSVRAVEMLEEYRGLQAKYEHLEKEMYDIDAHHPEDDEALLREALGRAIDNIRDIISAMEYIRAGGAS